MAGGSHVVRFHHPFGRDFSLHAEEEIVNVRIPQALGQDNASQECLIRVHGVPARKISHRLSANSLPRIRGRTGVCGRSPGGRAHNTGTYRRSVNDSTRHAGERSDFVERVIRWIPASIGKWVIESALVRYAESATQRSFAVAEHIPGETYAWSKVAILIGTEAAGWGESAGTANSCQNLSVGGDGIRTARAAKWSIGIRDLSRNSRYGGVGPSQNKRRRRVAFLGVPFLEIPAQAQVQGQTLGGLPIILYIGSDFPVPPMALVAGERGLRAWIVRRGARDAGAELRIHPRDF